MDLGNEPTERRNPAFRETGRRDAGGPGCAERVWRCVSDVLLRADLERRLAGCD